MTHPETVVHLEHDGKILLVDESGFGPQIPVKGRTDNSGMLRFPTIDEIENLDIEWEQKRETHIEFNDIQYIVIKGYPKLSWPKNWSWKDDVISDNCVHPVTREAIYRSIHRLVSKVIVRNSSDQILLAKVSRGHFTGHWTLPGGYMEHDEHPKVGCVREAMEELGLELIINDSKPIITQQIFSSEGISFVSFTYQSNWEGNLDDLILQEDEISAVKWFDVDFAISIVPSYFDSKALKALKD
ncbi:MAG: hypothetical protein CMA92_00165 [Euryarchaeota archaeon]|nr:hypothetical protein [Euryarchaeota archaeon]|tara:strand:- start:1137 stop:1862 length:726 start_codon:yes stop_codon:yes gene_type:complete